MQNQFQLQEDQYRKLIKKKKKMKFKKKEKELYYYNKQRWIKI